MGLPRWQSWQCSLLTESEFVALLLAGCLYRGQIRLKCSKVNISYIWILPFGSVMGALAIGSDCLSPHVLIICSLPVVFVCNALFLFLPLNFSNPKQTLFCAQLISLRNKHCDNLRGAVFSRNLQLPCAKKKLILLSFQILSHLLASSRTRFAWGLYYEKQALGTYSLGHSLSNQKPALQKHQGLQKSLR